MCTMDIIFPKVGAGETHLKKLDIDCVGECVVTMDGNLALSENFRIEGENVHMNLESLKATNFVYKSTQGVCQISDFAITQNSAVKLDYGDVVLQS